MSFATRLAMARIDSECAKADERDRSEAAFQKRREAAASKDAEAPDPGARWSWSPPGAERKRDGGEAKMSDDAAAAEAPVGCPAHRFHPRRGRTRERVAAALAYWNDYWKQYDDPDMMELFDFESRHYREFDPDVDEHAHSHAALHAEYRELFERVCGNHLVAVLGTTPDDFADELRRDLNSGDGDRRAKAEEFLDIVHKADDYAEFAESMKAAVRSARWLEEPD